MGGRTGWVFGLLLSELFHLPFMLLLKLSLSLVHCQKALKKLCWAAICVDTPSTTLGLELTESLQLSCVAIAGHGGVRLNLGGESCRNILRTSRDWLNVLLVVELST